LRLTATAVDRQGCPPGTATDQVFFTQNPPGACDANLNGFIATAVIILAAKLFIAVQHSRVWLRRAATSKPKQQLSSSSSPFGTQRIPFVPTLSWLFFLALLLYFVGGGTNVFNAHNGWTPFLFGFGWFVFALSAIFFLLKFVSLGHRIAPRTKNNVFRSISGLDKLSKFDTAGKISLVLCIVAMIVQTVLLCVVQMIPGVETEVIIRAALGCSGWFVLQHMVSINHHFQRVKGVYVDKLPDPDSFSSH